MHFVENDEFVRMGREIKLGVRQPGAIRIGL
jgi:hypothetical protein